MNKIISRFSHLIFGFILIFGLMIFVSQPVLATGNAKISLKLKKKNISQFQLMQLIRKQAIKKGVKLSGREAQSAARSASSKLSSNRGPLKGKIVVKTRKITLCVAWGNDSCG